MITLAEHAPMRTVMAIIVKHDDEIHGGWETARWHSRGVHPGTSTMLYDVYCLECDPSPETNKKGE